MKAASSASIETTVSTSFRSQASAYSLDDLAQPLVAERAQRLLLALLRQPLLDRRAGALQGAVHRGDAGVERVRRLLGGEAEHLAQDQHRALVGGQQLEGGDEGELDGLALLVAGVGRGVAVLDAEGLVGVRLDPDRLDQRLADAAVRIGGRPVVDRQDPLGPALDRVQGGVGRDPVEPGAQRAAALELGQSAPGANQRFLERVLGVLDGAQHPVAVGVELGAVGLDQAAIGVLVALAGRLEQLRSPARSNLSGAGLIGLWRLDGRDPAEFIAHR